MANPQEQKAIDKAEFAAHQINNLAAAAEDATAQRAEGQMCHCLVCRTGRPEMGQPISSIKWVDRPKRPPEFEIVARIKQGMGPDGAFRAESSDGAQISLHIDQNGGLVLVVEDKVLVDENTSRMWKKAWVLRRPKNGSRNA